MATRAPGGPRPSRLIIAILVLLVFLAAMLVVHPPRAQAADIFGALRSPGERVVIAGHRGDRGDAPENTLPAFRRAFASDAEFVETDIQLTRDRVPVLMHDSTVNRTTNGRGRLAGLDWAQLRRLDAGRWFGKRFARTRVPSLAQFLEIFAPSGKRALLELKNEWSPSEVRLVTDLVYASGAQDRVVFISKSMASVASLKLAAPTFPRAIIHKRVPKDAVAFVRRYGAIALLTTERSLLKNPKQVRALHRAGIGLLLYTLDAPKHWSSALALGVDGIVTDSPGSLCDWLAKRTEQR